MLNKLLDLFREIKRKICPHNWNYIREFHRECKICGEYQVMVYHRFGPIRTEWQSYNID